MQRTLSTLYLIILVLPTWQPGSKSLAEETKISIKGSFFELHFDKNSTSPKQAQQVRKWLEDTWLFFIKQGYKNPQKDGHLIIIHMEGSFLLTNYSQLDTCPHRIYLSVDLGKTSKKKKQEKTLIAHEIFHIFQSVYYWPTSKLRQESAWLFEGTALLAAAHASDNMDILNSFPYQDDLPLYNNAYGAAWFWKYLNEKFKAFTLKEVWESLSKENPANGQEMLVSLSKTIRRHTGKSISILMKEFLDYY